MLVTLVMLATCFGLLCGIGILFGIVGLLLKFGGKVLGACATILLPIGVIWLGFKIVFAVVPLLFKLVCAALICYLVYRILREMKLVALKIKSIRYERKPAFRHKHGGRFLMTKTKIYFQKKPVFAKKRVRKK